MARTRSKRVAVVMLLLVASCTVAENANTSSDSSTSSAPTSSLPPQPTPTSEVSAPTTTTAPPLASHAQLLIFNATGLTYFTDTAHTDVAVTEWIWGDVSQEATVTINGTPTKVTHVGPTSFGPDWWRWNDADEADGGVGVSLDLGLNTIEVTATFTDGSTLTRYVRRNYDPTLVSEQGYIVHLEPGDPPMATLELVEFTIDEWGVSDPGTRSEVVDVPIADDAVFTVLPLHETWGTVTSLTDMLELQSLNAQGLLDGFWWACFFPQCEDELESRAAPWEFLLTGEGHLQQASQLYSP